jgi:regulator of protease activity HflC (stomatin/prohibitin superfamily)
VSPTPTLAAAPPHLAGAGRLVRPLLVASGVSLLLTLVALAAAQDPGRDVLAPLAAYGVLLTAVVTTTAWLVLARRDAVQEVGPEPRADAAEAPQGPGTAGLELRRFGRAGVGTGLALGGVAALVYCATALAGGLADEPLPPRAALVEAVRLGLLALVFRAAAYVARRTPVERLPEAPGLATWLIAGQWLAGLLGAGLLLQAGGLDPADGTRWLARACLVLCAACAVEVAARGVARALRPPVSGAGVQVPTASAVLGLLLPGRNPLAVLAEGAERRLGLTLRSTWALTVLRRALGPAALAAALVAWGATALVVIGPEEQGLRFRLGRLSSPSPLEPGLAVTLPWPLEVVERLPVRRAQTLPLGYAGLRKAALLWAEGHAGEEYRLLLGEGRELVSVDGVVTYRIRDPAAYALAFQNPREALDALAYRRLMLDTVALDLDRLLSADREAFARGFARRLQEACDAAGLGVEILHVGFASLHPPVDVARAYQAVVSAEVDRETQGASARATAAVMGPAAEAEAVQAAGRAEAAAAARRAEAAGAAARFESLLEQHRAAPELFRFGRRLEALETGLADVSLYVVDRTLRARGGELWLDLRPTPSGP